MKNGVKNIQAVAYNGACMVVNLGIFFIRQFSWLPWFPEKSGEAIEFWRQYKEHFIDQRHTLL